MLAESDLQSKFRDEFGQAPDDILGDLSEIIQDLENSKFEVL